MVDIDHDCAVVEIVGSRINLGGTLAYFDIDGRFRILSTLALHTKLLPVERTREEQPGPRHPSESSHEGRAENPSEGFPSEGGKSVK